MKHVLIIPSEVYVPSVSELGGLFQFHQAKALQNHGFKVGICASGFYPLRNLFAAGIPTALVEDEFGIGTVKWYEKSFLPQRVLVQQLSFFPLKIWFMRYRLFAERELGIKAYHLYCKNFGVPDMIHAHNCWCAGYIAHEINKREKTPYVLTEHSSVYGRYQMDSNHSEHTKKIMMNAASVIAVSRSLSELIQAKVRLPKRPEVVANVLEQRFELLNDGIKTVNDKCKFVFFHAANLDENKNQFCLLNAFADAFLASKVKLKIAGRGSLRGRLERHAMKLGISAQVTFLGQLNRDQMLQEMNDCNCFVLASRVETFGVTLIEALACGKPVISTMSGGPNEIVNGTNGLLVEVDNVSALADAMRYVKDNITIYEAENIRKNCIASYGAKSFVEKVSAIYSRVLE